MANRQTNRRTNLDNTDSYEAYSLHRIQTELCQSAVTQENTMDFREIPLVPALVGDVSINAGLVSGW